MASHNNKKDFSHLINSVTGVYYLKDTHPSLFEIIEKHGVKYGESKNPIITNTILLLIAIVHITNNRTPDLHDLESCAKVAITLTWEQLNTTQINFIMKQYKLFMKTEKVSPKD